MENQPKQTMVSLNEAIDLISSLSSGKLKELVQLGRASGLAQCDYLCDCNNRYCTCHGSVSKIAEFGDKILPADEYEKLRKQKIEELTQQLRILEGRQ